MVIDIDAQYLAQPTHNTQKVLKKAALFDVAAAAAAEFLLLFSLNYTG